MAPCSDDDTTTTASCNALALYCQRGLPSSIARGSAVEDGTSPGEVSRSTCVNFRREKLIESALRGWTSAHLEQAIMLMTEAALETRRRADLAETGTVPNGA
jgi:hypothetical protein